MSKKLNSYTGKLNPSQIADGMNAANRNVIRLVTDAKILLNAERFPSSAALSIIIY